MDQLIYNLIELLVSTIDNLSFPTRYVLALFPTLFTLTLSRVVCFRNPIFFSYMVASLFITIYTFPKRVFCVGDDDTTPSAGVNDQASPLNASERLDILMERARARQERIDNALQQISANQPQNGSLPSQDTSLLSTEANRALINATEQNRRIANPYRLRYTEEEVVEAYIASQKPIESSFPEEPDVNVEELETTARRIVDIFQQIYDDRSAVEQTLTHISLFGHDFSFDWLRVFTLMAPLVFIIISVFLAQWVVSHPLIKNWDHPFNAPIDRSGLTPLFLFIGVFLSTVTFLTTYGTPAISFVFECVLFYGFIFLTYHCLNKLIYSPRDIKK